MEHTKVLKELYKYKNNAMAVAGYLKSFGQDAEVRCLKGWWRVVVYKATGEGK